MSIQYVDHHQIDPTKWDSAILRSPHPLVYGMFEYLNAVCDSQWDALIYKDYEAVFPLPFKKKFGIKYLVQPVFCQQLGAFGSNAKVSTHNFLSAIPKRFLRVRLQLNPYFDQKNEVESILTKPWGKGASSGKLTTKTNMTIQLSQPLDYNKDCKKNLHRLAELPIEYKINAILIRDAIDTYRKAWGRQNPEIGDDHYQLFANACSEKLSFTVTAHHRTEGTLLGAAIFLITPENANRSLHYVCAGPTEPGKSIGVMHGIIDFVLERYQGENMLFDFEGSSIASIASFYKKFGANEEPFFLLQSRLLNFDSQGSDYLRVMNPWIQAARLRTLPLALSGILLGTALSHMCVSAVILSDRQLTQTLSNSGNPIGPEGLKLGFHASPFVITLLAILTATALQVLSNFANDYGDFSKGTDTKANRSDRMLASGKISEKSMKRAIWFMSLITLILGILLIYISGLFETRGGFYLLAIGLLALFAAITYTVGKNAYGYLGLGDLFVLIFFGFVPVLGMGLLNGLFLNEVTCQYLDVFLIAGLGLGLLSTGVLNVNNYRDIPTDKEQNKQTLAVRLGAKKTIVYHRLLLLLGGGLIPMSFLTFEKRYFEWPEIFGLQPVFLIGIFSPIFLLLSSHYQAVKAAEPGDRETLNPQLKKLSLTVLAMVLLYVFLAFFILDFFGH